MRSILEKALIALLNEEKDKASGLFEQFLSSKTKQINESSGAGQEAMDEVFTDGIAAIKGQELDSSKVTILLSKGSEVQLPSEMLDLQQDSYLRYADEAEFKFIELNGKCYLVNVVDQIANKLNVVSTSELLAKLTELVHRADTSGFDANLEDDLGESYGDEDVVTQDDNLDDDFDAPLALVDDSEEVDDHIDDEEETIEDRVSNLETELDRLGSEFDELMGDEDTTESDSDDTIESVDESQTVVTMPKGDGRLQGDIKFKQNKVSPVLNVPFEKRSATAKPVVNKSTEKNGFDKETAPTVKPIMKAKAKSVTPKTVDK